MEIEKDKFVEIKRKGNVGHFVYIPSNYPGPIAISATIDQPERSKREDSVTYLEDLDKTDGYQSVMALGEIEKKSIEMRCSEHYGDIVRPAEKIWPA